MTKIFKNIASILMIGTIGIAANTEARVKLSKTEHESSEVDILNKLKEFTPKDRNSLVEEQMAGLEW